METKASANPIAFAQHDLRWRQINDEPVDPALTTQFPYSTDLGRYPKTKHTLCHFHPFASAIYGASTGENGHSIETRTTYGER